MRTRARWTTLGLLVAALACGDQPTEVVPERQGEGAIAAEPAGTVAFATASTDDGLTITTDKDDYQPGDIVHLTGRGWPGDDSLDILLEDAPATHAALRWTIATDGDGSFQDSTYVVDEGDLDVTFTLTATSRASGRSLSVTFTDGNLQTLSLNPASRTTTPTGSASYTINVGMGGSGTTCTVTLSVLSLPALPSGANASIPNNVVNATDQDFSRTLTITTSAVAPGTYPFTVQAGRGANCQGNGNVTVNGTLVVSGPAAKLVFSQPPSNENAATPITPAITVSVLDAGNNLVTGSTAAITLSIGTNSGGGTLSGTLTQNAVNGVATFSDVSIDKQGNGYTLIASSPGLTQVTSVGFAINRGPAAKLAFTAQPSGGSPGGVFPGQPSIAVQDAGGNLINSGPGSGSSITLTIEAGTGTAGAALTCNANPLNASNGVATFANCRINLAGIGYRLRATSGALAVAVSDLFDITASNQAPNVDAGGPYTVVEGTELTLAPSVSDADADPLTYEWSVVTTGIDANGTCTFVDATVKDAKLTCTDDSQGGPSGKFSLSLEVSDGVAATVTDVADLTVTNAAPVAAAGGPYSGSEGSAIGLNGSADDPGDNDDAGLTYAWSVNTNICTFDNATKKNAEVTCTDNGTFTLTLKASDDDGDTSPGSTATLTISNDDPVADAGGPYTGKEGDVIGLDGTVSDAGAGDTHVWSWEYVSGPDDGGSCTISAPTAEDPTIKCTDDGVVKLTLTVTDDDGGTGADEATLTLANVAPTVLAGGPYGGDEGEAIQLTGSFTDPGSNDTHTKLWTAAPVSGVDAGATCSFLPNATSVAPTVSCTDDGTWKVTLKVTDDDNGVGTAYAELALVNRNPVANAGGPYSGKEGQVVQLNGSVDDPGANDTHVWSWEYISGPDDGGSCTISAPTAEDPTIKCTDDGVVKLTLTVTDDDDGVGTDEATLTLTNAVPVVMAGSSYSGSEGSGTALTGSFTDAGANDTHTKLWTATPGAGVDGGATCSFSPNAAALTPSVTCTDDGTWQLTLTVTDDDGGAGFATASLTVSNVAPVIATLTRTDGSALPTTSIVAGVFKFRVPFGDAGANDTHIAALECEADAGFTPLGAVAKPSFDTECTFATVGPKVISVRVTDDDGMSHVQTHSLTVKYNFDGFYAPVNRPDTMNVSKAGQAIPLKWRLTDANGAPVTNLATITIQAVNLGCSLGDSNDQLEEYAAGSSGLQNQGNGYYQFNWKTPASYSSSCKSIKLVFGAGALSYTEGPHAYFSFKK